MKVAQITLTTLNDISSGHDERGGVYLCRMITQCRVCALRDLEGKMCPHKSIYPY